MSDKPVLDRFGRELKPGQWVAQPKARQGSASVAVAMIKEVNGPRDVRVVHFDEVNYVWNERTQTCDTISPPTWKRTAVSKINISENLIIMDVDVVASPSLLEWIETELGGDPFGELSKKREEV